MPDKAEIRKLKELIKDIQFAMLTTVEPDGSLRSRPMAAQSDAEVDELWFFTSTDSPKVNEVERDRHVNVAFADPNHNRFISVSGLATVIRDRDRIDEFWNPLHKAWFPLGKDDPNIGLLRVRISHAEYWDTATSRMVQLAGLAKSIATGKPARPGEYRQLSFDEDAGRTSAYAHDKGEARVDPQTHILSPLDESLD
jgi:general stress protein 26